MESARNAKVDVDVVTNGLEHKSNDLSSWSPEPGDKEANLQIDFDQPVTIMDLLTQGSVGQNKWTKTFFVQYSTDRENYHFVKDDNSDLPKVKS